MGFKTLQLGVELVMSFFAFRFVGTCPMLHHDTWDWRLRWGSITTRFLLARMIWKWFQQSQRAGWREVTIYKLDVMDEGELMALRAKLISKQLELYNIGTNQKGPRNCSFQSSKSSAIKESSMVDEVLAGWQMQTSRPDMKTEIVYGRPWFWVGTSAVFGNWAPKRQPGLSGVVSSNNLPFI